MKARTIKSEVDSKFNCSLETAFKTPILGDARKFFLGNALIPGVHGFEEDETWGKEGGHRYPISKATLFVKQGRVFDDMILKREENKYWKWCIFNFNTNLLFFATKAEGELFFNSNAEGSVSVKWIYTFYSKNIVTYPITWAFTKIIWHSMQRKAIVRMKHSAEHNAPFIYQ